MRRLIFAALGAAALASAGSLASSRAEAMPMGNVGATTGQAEQVALVCNRVWNGYAWVRQCYRTAPEYYAPRPYYGYGYGGYYRPRPRYYGYY